jgi:SAM-dependent methyltransferase
MDKPGKHIDSEAQTFLRQGDFAEYFGKKILAFLRKGDFGHPGEIEAIDLVMKRFPKDERQLILDVGCGLGGTAGYIQEQKYGQISGFDIEPKSIEYAQKKYPHVHFYAADVLNVDRIITDVKFDILCLFNSFYAFPDQALALQKLTNIAKKNARIAIFDYSNFCETDKANPLFRSPEKNKLPFIPIKSSAIASTLLGSGWQLDEWVDISQDYQRWYRVLLDKLDSIKEEMSAKYGEEIFNKTASVYHKIYRSIVDKSSGGVIVYAHKI